ncbi:MAG: GNAT family N-acetyltransferase [Anaerolineales bacterium]|jgi:hypothetical protein
MFKLTRFDAPEDFLEITGEELYKSEVVNSLMLGIVERLLDDPNYFGTDPYLGLVHTGEDSVLAATMTPPFGLLISALRKDAKAAMPLLVEDLVSGGWPLPDVHGANPSPEQFAEVWAAHTGGKIKLDMAQRLYALHEVTLPESVPGRMIQAGSDHAALIAEWMRYFEIDSFGQAMRSIEESRKAAEGRIAKGDWYLWEVGGEVVSMALQTRPIKHGCSVGGVYTPPKHRRNGYASACVAALSQKLLEVGFEYTSLFTDLANPTSNSIYKMIGYRPVADFNKYKLIEPK